MSASPGQPTRSEGQRDGAEPAIAGPGQAGTPGPITVEHRLPPGTVARATLVVVAVLLGFYLLWLLRDVLLLLFLAVLCATAIDPIVDQLRRGPFSRGAGVLVVYGAIVLAIVLPAYLLLPSIVAQVAAFTESLPDRLQGLRQTAEGIQHAPLRAAAVNAVDRLTQAAQAPAPPEAQLVEAGATALHTVINIVTVFVLAFYWLTERAQIKRALLRAVPPERARGVNALWLEVEEKLGGWVRGQLLLMLSIGVMAGLGYWVIGLPHPAVLALVAAVAELIPMIGPFLAFAPAVLVALAIDPSRALIVAAYAAVIQQIEGAVLVPRVMGHTVGVSPLTVLLGILAGAALYGLPGAFLAVPVAGALQVVLAHVLRQEGPDQAEAHRAETRGASDPAEVPSK